MPAFLQLSLAAATLAASVSVTAELPTIPLTLPSGKRLQVEVATTDEQRATGLMFRKSLPSDRGMLFVFDEPGFYSFWMKNCRFPIDILWLDDEQRVVHLAESVPPCQRDPCPSVRPLRRARYVLELNAHQARQEKAVIGGQIEFKLPQ